MMRYSAWQPSATAALASLALRSRENVGAQADPVVVDSQVIPAQSHVYARHHWLDPAGGSDVLGPGRGSEGLPWRTFAAWSNFWGAPTDVSDFQRAIHLHVGATAVGDDNDFLPPSRRIVIHGAGAVLAGLLWDVDDADRFGSPLLPELTIIGGARSGPLALAVESPTAQCQVGTGSDGSIAVSKKGVGTSSHILNFVNCLLPGDIAHSGGFAAGIPNLFLDNCTVGGDITVTPGTGVVRLWEARDTLFSGALAALYAVQHMRDCQVLCGMNVVAVPEVLFNDGVKGCRFEASSHWSGPALSLFGDYTTRHWIDLNGVTVTPGAGSFIESQVAWP